MRLKSFLTSFLLAAIAANSASAFSLSNSLSDTILDYMDKNGTYYYNPNGFALTCFPGLGSYDGIATAGLSDLQSSFIDTYYQIASTLGAEYGIPWETVMAQGIIESRSGTSNFAVNRNNFFGLGAVDGNSDNAYSYSTPADGWRGYFEFIKNNPRYTAAGAFNHQNDPYGYLSAIKSAGYATDPYYVPKVGSYISAIENRASEKNWSLSSNGSTQTSTTPLGTTLLNSCSAINLGNGDINATALALSWADRTHSLDDPKPEYLAALQKIGLSNYGEEFVNIGASCDAFVATVLRFSGADPNVPCCGTSTMLSYFASSPKYQEIPNIGNPSNLQPGDIRIRNGHVELYVYDGVNGRIASASHGDRTADHGINYYADSSYRVFRLISGGNGNV
ncbi:glucosaminidase domain-containing protein [Candidatus Saccharibacteria bacterium]|nr:glucosaminidase domain-containing protein [Candidatus Saccharibacteria bacterium]